jgi:hypothetical protein
MVRELLQSDEIEVDCICPIIRDWMVMANDATWWADGFAGCATWEMASGTRLRTDSIGVMQGSVFRP